ncbi:MAG: helix-turn-helix domain-containing protein [Acidobacteria bacterium]|nr:helix-turn-helix domain-containing protein [Acidobacteriota bacterium]
MKTAQASIKLDDPLASARATAVARLQRRLDELADAMVVAYQREIAAYTTLDDPTALADVRRSSLTNAQVIFRTVAEGTPLDEQTLAFLRELGRRRALQGFPLHGVLRAYQVGTKVALQFLLEELSRIGLEPRIHAEVVAQTSIMLLGLTAQVSGAVSQAFLETEREIAQTEERVRRDVFEEMLAGPVSGGEPLRERAGRVGYRLGEAHAVITIAVLPAELGGDPSPAERESLASGLASALREVLLGGLRPLVQTRSLMVIGIVPVAVGTAEGKVLRAIEGALGRAAAPQGLFQGALGRVERGVSGIPVSYHQALRTLDAARATGASPRISSYTETLPWLLLLEDPSLTTDLWRSTVEPLAVDDAERSGQLVATLEAFFEERGNLLATAKRLFVHRHTLSARLQRIEELTGRDLRERRDLLLLELGLSAQRVLPAEGPAAPQGRRRLARAPGHLVRPGPDKS